MADKATVFLTGQDLSHEVTVANAILAKWPGFEFHPTPKFFPFDFHIMRVYQRGSADYLGGLEVKWFNHDSTKPGVFNFNKLLQLLAMTVHRDDPDCHHRVAFRFTDGILISSARDVARNEPFLFTRKDRNETDLVVRVNPATTPGTWISART